MADSVRDSIIVSAPTAVVRATVTDLPAYPQWQPEITSVEVLETDADGLATTARFVIDARLLTVTCTLAYAYDDAGMRWRLVEGDGLARNDGCYLLADLGDGRTQLTYELTVEPTVSVPAVLRRQIAQHIVDGALRGAKARAEATAA